MAENKIEKNPTVINRQQRPVINTWCLWKGVRTGDKDEEKNNQLFWKKNPRTRGGGMWMEL